MHDDDALAASTTDALPVAPSLGPTLRRLAFPHHGTHVGGRVVVLTGLAVGLAVAATAAAQLLGTLIALATQLAYHGRWSTAPAAPAPHHLGTFAVAVPVIGGVIVGIMARYGSRAIRGHGIPEAMEQVLTNDSRVPLRMTFLKPLSAAIAIGSGGPFGAEGPIIATGGALGSALGQLLPSSPDERKTLLAAGAAAGMAATFGTPVAAVLLAIELLLFEYRARSLVPVAAATATATALRHAVVGAAPAFGAVSFAVPGLGALAGYLAIGAVAGLAAVALSRLVYWIEDGFERLPIHWMWWPALGGIAVGVMGLIEPRSLGVGYDNIEQTLTGNLAGTALAALCAAKLVSWSIALGSGTSGGTLAPLLTIGGALGGLLAGLIPAVAGVDPRLAALVGMAATFAGASRAFLASVVFAFETTGDPGSLLPLLAGGAAAYLVSCLLAPTSIMTEKLARRGVRLGHGYAADRLEQLHAGEVCSRDLDRLDADTSIADARLAIERGSARTRQGFPVVAGDALVGVVTRRELLDDAADPAAPVRSRIKRPPITVRADRTLREVVNRMAAAGVGRIVVVERGAPRRPIGIVTRSDIIAAEGGRGRRDAPSAAGAGWM